MKRIIAVPIAVLALAVAGCGGSTVKPAAQPATVSGTETITGHVTGRAALAHKTIIPLTYRGPVDTSGTFSTNGSGPVKGQLHAFRARAGVMEARVVSLRNRQGLVSAKTCAFAFSTTVHFALVGARSTGVWAGDSGSGVVTVLFQGNLPRVKSGKRKGKCNESASASPSAKSAVASFTATETVKLKAHAKGHA